MKPSRLREIIAICALAGGLWLTGCGGSETSAPADIDAAIEKWKASGLEVSEFTEADAATFAASSCRAGTIAGVDVTICDCADDAAAKAAQNKGLAWVGENTGTSLTAGKMLLSVRDPRKSDPNGKSINKIVNDFRGK